MLIAMCADTGMLIGFLFFLLLLGALIVTTFLVGLVAFARWADRRQKRMAAEDLAAAGVGSTLNL